jgi:hypothetical protein
LLYLEASLDGHSIGIVSFGDEGETYIYGEGKASDRSMATTNLSLQYKRVLGFALNSEYHL